jgi:hypothetical protein
MIAIIVQIQQFVSEVENAELTHQKEFLTFAPCPNNDYYLR